MIPARALFSPAQTRAARALLDWTQERLAEAAGLELETIGLFERNEGDLSAPEIAQLGRTLNMHGIIALPPQLAGAGVRFRRPSTSPAARWSPWTD